MKRLAGLFLAALLAFAPVAHADLRASSGAFGPSAITSGTIKVDDGAAATPSYSFTNSTGAGAFYSGANNWRAVAQGGSVIAQFGGNISQLMRVGALAIGDPTAVEDTYLQRDAANTLALKNGNTAQEFRVYAGNGGFISNVKTVTESLPIAAAATTVGATSIPAGALLIGVSVRVTTVIPTAATFTITTTVGGTTLNTAAVSTAANSTDPGTAAGVSFRSAATTVTITPNLTPGTATGVVRLQYYYLQITPPTS